MLTHQQLRTLRAIIRASLINFVSYSTVERFSCRKPWQGQVYNDRQLRRTLIYSIEVRPSLRTYKLSSFCVLSHSGQQLISGVHTMVKQCPACVAA